MDFKQNTQDLNTLLTQLFTANETIDVLKNSIDPVESSKAKKLRTEAMDGLKRLFISKNETHAQAGDKYVILQKNGKKRPWTSDMLAAAYRRFNSNEFKRIHPTLHSGDQNETAHNFGKHAIILRNTNVIEDYKIVIKDNPPQEEIYLR
jgi:hypothetical protein